MSQTVDRSLKILDLVADQPQRTKDIADALGIHPSTALRLLHTLRDHGFVRDEDHRYRLGPATFRLGFRALEDLDLRSVARPFMTRLRDQTLETVHVGVLVGDDVVYIEKVEAMHPVRMYSRIGTIAPIHCTGIAKAILAFLGPDEQSRLISAHELRRFTDQTLTTPDALGAELARARANGFAVDDEEHEIGIRCAAAPIIRGDGVVLGGLSISAPTGRIDEETLMGFAPPLIEAAARISEEFGGTPVRPSSGSRSACP